MVGDKVHDDPRDAGYKRRMRAALGEVGTPAVPGVIWHGGQPRAEAMRLAASCDIGLSWRHPDLDASLELSTKVLEFGQLGLPVILNRTPMHEALLGADYPLFAASLDDVADAAAACVADPAVFALAAARTSAAAREFTLDKAADRLRGYLARAVSAGRRRCRRCPREPAAAGGHRGPRPEVLHPADRVLQAPAWPRGPGRPVGVARRARRGGLQGAGRMGRRGHLRVVRPERRLVQPPQAPRHPADRPPAPVRAVLALSGPGEDRQRRPGDLRQRALRPADQGAHWLAGREGRVGAEPVDVSQLDRPKLDGAAVPPRA